MDPTEDQPTPTPTTTAAAADGPTSMLDRLPEELIIRILDYALARDTPFDLEGCVDLLRNGLFPLHNGGGHTEPFPGFTFQPHEQQQRDTREYPEWHKVHLQDWLMANATCRRFRRLGRPLYFRNRTVVVSQLLPGKLKHFEEHRGFGPAGDDRPLYHPLLLGHVRDIVLVNINSVSASKFLKIPAFVKSFPSLETCTLQLDYRPDDHMDQLKRAAVVEGDASRRVPATLTRLLVDIGMDESVRLRLALYEVRPEESWHETIVRENVFPMLRQRKRMMSHATQAR